MRVELQAGYVLHQRPYRNTSQLVEVFTPQYGRVGLVARGTRRPRRGQPSLLQPFQRMLLSWHGGGELATMSAAECVAQGPGLTGAAVWSGFYLNELLMRLVQRQDPHPALFEHYDAAVHALRAAAGESDALERVLRLFEKHLLQELGYGLILDCDVATGETVQPQARYCYQLDSGPHRAAHGSAGLVVRGSSLLSLARGELADSDSLRDAKKLMRAALAPHLGERPLQSRRLFRAQRPAAGAER